MHLQQGMTSKSSVTSKLQHPFVASAFVCNSNAMCVRNGSRAPESL